MIQCMGVLCDLGAQLFDIPIRQAGFSPFGVIKSIPSQRGDKPFGFHGPQRLNQSAHTGISNFRFSLHSSSPLLSPRQSREFTRFN